MRLFIRTEASPQIGMGHFMRCFAVAEEARAADIPAIFLLNEASAAVRSRMDSIGARLLPVTTVIGAEDDLCGIDLGADDWLLADSYRFTPQALVLLHRRCHLAFIDDLKAFDRYDCDVLINAAMAAVPEDYAGQTQARLLLGPPHALIRREFRQTYPPTDRKPSVSIMFGGSDPTGLTASAIRLLHNALPEVMLKVIAGPANTTIGQLKDLARDLPEVRLFVDPPSVAAVLAYSDLVITAAGGSVGEVAALALPALALVVVDNQAAAFDGCPYPVLDARGGLPDGLAERVQALLDDPVRRQRIAQNAHGIVDGLGPRRIVEAMTHV